AGRETTGPPSDCSRAAIRGEIVVWLRLRSGGGEGNSGDGERGRSRRRMRGERMRVRMWGGVMGRWWKGLG
ncbi:hypothetical protein, partial [Brevibacterium casei]|uniref:hypothetical protein n=1 Tax=Brevibacterium casei TaxID=33889 RepID=UPI001C92ECA2